MSNIVMLKPQLRQSSSDRLARLIAGFATQRRPTEDVFWLKENAEFLGILSATGAQLDAQALAPFEAFYAQITDRIRFFPQYYRFLLSLCLDLEDLGIAGDTGRTLAQWVADEGLVQAELSDLQRAEAQRLLARRGVTIEGAQDLEARLRAFMARSQSFAMPNKKAAYELTHIVFYLSEYGKVGPDLGQCAKTSLTYAGLLAYLDQNMDLLAEVCTALRFAGDTPPVVWEETVAQAHGSIGLNAGGQGDLNDAYHEYLVTGWAMDVAGATGFEAAVPDGTVRFTRRTTPQGALRTLSECMFGMGEARSGNWYKMRPYVLPMLGPEGHEVLAAAIGSTDMFEPFFERFARAGMR